MGYSDCGTLFYYTGRICGLACLERALNAFNIMGMCDRLGYVFNNCMSFIVAYSF